MRWKRVLARVRTRSPGSEIDEAVRVLAAHSALAGRSASAVPACHPVVCQREGQGGKREGRATTASNSVGPVIALLRFTPIEFLHLGPIRVSPHGIATAVGFLLGARLLLQATRSRAISDEVVQSMLTRAALGALIGARLAYALNHIADYDSVLDVLRIWEGGLSLFGGIAGGILAAVPVMRSERLRFWPLMDAAAPGLALGIVIGRIGDLIVGDHLGKQTDFFAGFTCTAASSASPCRAPIGAGVHMPALYDLVSVGLLLVVLLRLRKRHVRFDGALILIAAGWYGAGRFIEDFFRIDDTVALGLSGSQLTAASLVILAFTCQVLGRVPFSASTQTPQEETVRPEAESGAG
jgi:phosphatidylglycerol:prolipoprotein diacylglycerol transferase